MKQQIKKVKASPVLTDLVNEWADCYIKSVDLPVKILKLAKEEGLDKTEIRLLIVEALQKRGLSERRIREVMPEKLKEMSKANKPKLDAAESAASDEDLKLDSELKNMASLPVTTPDTIIMKSEAEIQEDLYNKDMNEQQELSIKKADVQQLIDNKILTEEQVHKWSNDKYLETFQIPKDINITKGAYHAKLSPAQAVSQIKQLGNSVKTLEIGWKIIG
jgi:hypothetical protein